MPKKKKSKKPILQKTRPLISTILDQIKLDPVEIGLYGGLAYMGYKAFGNKPEMGLFGPVALRLAQAQNLVAGASGVAGLVYLGLAFPTGDPLQPIQSAIGQLSGAFEEEKKYYDKNNIPEEAIEAKTSVTFFEPCPKGYQHRIPYALGLAAVCVKVKPEYRPLTDEEKAARGGVG